MVMQDLKQRTFSNLIRISLFFLIIQLFSCFVILVDAQSEIVFTAVDIFEIHSNNSSIRFASNGTFEMANLENMTWTFKNLNFPNSLGTEKLNLKISATDCDLTIYPFRISYYQYGEENLKWIILTYTVNGHGTQVINLGLDPVLGQLDVILDGEFIGRNQGWTRSIDGTLNITGASATATLWYIGYPDSSGTLNFFDEHYVLFGSTFSVSIIVVLAFLIQKKKRGETIIEI